MSSNLLFDVTSLASTSTGDHIGVTLKTIKVISNQFWLSFDLGDQASNLLLAPAFGRTGVIQIMSAFAFVVNDVHLRLPSLPSML